MLNRQARDQKLEKDHNGGVDRHQEAVLAFGDIVVLFRIDSEEGKDQDGCHAGEDVSAGKGQEAPVTQRRPEELSFFGLRFCFWPQLRAAGVL